MCAAPTDGTECVPCDNGCMDIGAGGGGTPVNPCEAIARSGALKHTAIAVGPGGCGGGGGATPLPSPVAVLPNNPGTHCHDSISGAGENVPTNTSDFGHQVKEIYTVSATISPTTGGQATGPMGYIYVDNNGQWYLGESPSYTGDAWQVIGSQLGFIGEFLTGEQEYGKNFDQPITPAQVQQMKGQHNGETIGVTPCVVPKANA